MYDINYSYTVGYLKFYYLWFWPFSLSFKGAKPIHDVVILDFISSFFIHIHKMCNLIPGNSEGNLLCAILKTGMTLRFRHVFLTSLCLSFTFLCFPKKNPFFLLQKMNIFSYKKVQSKDPIQIPFIPC